MNGKDSGLQKIKLPRVIRRNVFVIALCASFLHIFYYPFFMLFRRNEIQKVSNVKRYYIHTIVPFIGGVAILGVSMLTAVRSMEMFGLHSDAAYIYSEMEKQLLSESSAFSIAMKVATIFALVCFIFPMIDLLVQMSEQMKSLKVKFPGVMMHIPLVFTVLSFLYLGMNVLSLDPTWSNRGLETFFLFGFVGGIVACHIYIASMYVLFLSLKLQKGVQS